jgi:hypothetical protein
MRQARGSAAKLWPVNVGVKVFNGNHLHNGIAFFNTFIATFWTNYLSLGNTYGLNEQSAMMDVLRVPDHVQDFDTHRRDYSLPPSAACPSLPHHSRRTSLCVNSLH